MHPSLCSYCQGPHAGHRKIILRHASWRWSHVWSLSRYFLFNLFFQFQIFLNFKCLFNVNKLLWYFLVCVRSVKVANAVCKFSFQNKLKAANPIKQTNEKKKTKKPHTDPDVDMHTPVNVRLHKTHLGKGNRFCWLRCCQCGKKVFLLQLLYKHTSCTTPSVCFQLFIHLFTSALRSRALSLLCRKSLLLYSVFVSSARRQKRWESGTQWNSWDEQMSNCNATNHEGFFGSC